jgi:AcrR family transcriptional regulator
MKKKDTRSKILKAALTEFSLNGLSGTRVDNIARGAKVNKAMIFYYFSSKDNLYKEVLKTALKEISKEVLKKIALKPTVENIVEKLPIIHVEYLSKNPEFVRMVGLALMHNPEMIREFIQKIFKDRKIFSVEFLLKKIKKAYEKGKITESDPLQFIINLVSLNIFVFFAKPIIESIFDLKIDQIDGFYEKRIESIQNIIKRGMMK